MRILVITSCTNQKKHKPPNQLKYEDFASSERLRKRTEELKDFKAPAAKMYTGRQHRPLMEGLGKLRGIHGHSVVDLHIISAGYGLLNEDKIIVPYDVTFSGLKKKEILERSDNLHIHEQVESLIAGYDLVLYLLGKEYVQALQLPFNVPDTVTQVFLLGTGHRSLIPDSPNTHFVPAGSNLARELSVMGVALKGYVFKQFCEVVCREGFQVFEQVKEAPQRLLEIVRR